MIATCIKKVSKTDADNEYRILLRHEEVEIKVFEEVEFGILYHFKKWCLTNGTDIIAYINDYSKITIKRGIKKWTLTYLG